MITQTIEEILEDMETAWKEHWEVIYDVELSNTRDYIEREFYVDWLTAHGFNEDRIEQIMRRY